MKRLTVSELLKKEIKPFLFGAFLSRIMPEKIEKPDEFYEDNCDFFLTNNLLLKDLGLFVDLFLRCEGLIK